MATTQKAKIKTMNRELAKTGIYSATFGEAGTVQVDARTAFPAFDELSEVQKGLVFNGLTQKLNDSHAGAADSAEAYKWTKETADALFPAEGAGKWTVRIPGEGGGSGGNFAVAYAEFKGITVEDAREKIKAVVDSNMAEGKTEKQVYAAVKASVLKKYPAVQDIINRLNSEAAAKKEVTIDADL